MDHINIADIYKQIYKYLDFDIYSLYAVSKYFAHEVTEYVYSMEMPNVVAMRFPHINMLTYYSKLFETPIENEYMITDLCSDRNFINFNHRIIAKILKTGAIFTSYLAPFIVEDTTLRNMLISYNNSPLSGRFGDNILQVKLSKSELLRNPELVYNSNCGYHTFNLLASDIDLIYKLGPKYVNDDSAFVMVTSRYPDSLDIYYDEQEYPGHSALLWLAHPGYMWQFPLSLTTSKTCKKILTFLGVTNVF